MSAAGHHDPCAAELTDVDQKRDRILRALDRIRLRPGLLDRDPSKLDRLEDELAQIEESRVEAQEDN